MSKQSNSYKFVYYVISVFFLIVFNLYTSTYLSAISQDTILFLPGLKLNYMENTGAAFSILQDYKIVLIIFAVTAIIGIFCYLVKNLKELTMMNVFMIYLNVIKMNFLKTKTCKKYLPIKIKCYTVKHINSCDTRCKHYVNR